ncbi:MAG: YybH family protein [Gemmatimonadota bacterium]
MRRSHLLLAVGLLAMPAALSAQEYDEEAKPDDATAAIPAASEAFDAAWNERDWTAVAAMYTEDAVVMPPGSEPLQAREAILSYFSEGSGGVSLDLETLEVFSVEGAALEVGSWVMTAPDGSHVDHGNYMAAFSHTDDGWKIVRDMWNSNMAPAADE